MKAVVIGNGAAGLAAVKSFRKYDKTSPITVISKEGGEAYSRVLLPYVLRGKLSYDKLFLPFAKEFGRLGVEYSKRFKRAVAAGQGHKTAWDLSFVDAQRPRRINRRI